MFLYFFNFYGALLIPETFAVGNGACGNAHRANGTPRTVAIVSEHQEEG
jgi:hypothetical protein